MKTAKNINRFFSDLSWHREADFIYPVFNHYELGQFPLKRLKHLLLVYTGLKSLAELNREIFRFTMSQDGLLKAQETCFSLLANYHGTPNSSLIVLKMVFSTITMSLPNYRVVTPEQVYPVFDEIKKEYLGKADEIWVCLSDVSEADSNLGGRISYRLDTLYMPDILEIVWFTSPRMLDTYRVVDYPYPYLKAFKIPDRLSFVIDRMTIPERFFANQPDLEQRIFQDYNFVLCQLYRRKEQITSLCEILKLSRVKEVVIEFKTDSGHFKVIDWDTDAETEKF